MATFHARMNVTYSCLVYVEAETEKEAREKLAGGDWESETTLETVDWESPNRIEEDE